MLDNICDSKPQQTLRKIHSDDGIILIERGLSHTDQRKPVDLWLYAYGDNWFDGLFLQAYDSNWTLPDILLPITLMKTVLNRILSGSIGKKLNIPNLKIFICPQGMPAAEIKDFLLEQQYNDKTYEIIHA